MTDKLNITIRIAELPPIAMQIDRSEEENIRTAEYHVNKLWKTWTQRYTNKTPREVLAMVAFQFAKAFVTLSKETESIEKALAGMESELDKILLETSD